MTRSVVRSLAIPALLAAASTAACRRDAATPAAMEATIAGLEKERDALRTRVGALVAKDPRLEGMPEGEVRVGVPTSLARDLVSRLVAGFADQVALRLSGIKVRKAGTVRKVIPLGDYDLRVTIDEVTGRLETGRPDMKFGGNKVEVGLPVRVASGTGAGTIDFAWRGRSLGGAVCGDMSLHQKVTGAVEPADYSVRGTLLLTSTSQGIVASPHFPKTKVNLRVRPSAASWAAVQKLLDEKAGLCGFVLDRVDIRGLVEGLLGRGFDVTLPTDSIRPMAIPVGLAETMTVRGRPVTIGVEVGALAITKDMIWLGADVSLRRRRVASGSEDRNLGVRF
jgi:hypothetical protein